MISSKTIYYFILTVRSHFKNAHRSSSGFALKWLANGDHVVTFCARFRCEYALWIDRIFRLNWNILFQFLFFSTHTSNPLQIKIRFDLKWNVLSRWLNTFYAIQNWRKRENKHTIDCNYLLETLHNREEQCVKCHSEFKCKILLGNCRILSFLTFHNWTHLGSLLYCWHRILNRNDYTYNIKLSVSVW